MARKNKGNFHSVIFIVSVMLLSISAVSLIGVWQNRSFYFDGYIYSTNLYSAQTGYCGELRRLAGGELTKDEEDSFRAQTIGIYYYVTNENTKEVFSNITADMDYTEFAALPDIKTLTYLDEGSYIISAANYLETLETYVREDHHAVPLSGYIFIDTGAGSLLSSDFRYPIETGFSQQRVLYIESAVLAVSFLLGGIMLIISLRNREETARLTGRIPIDVTLSAPAAAAMGWMYIINTYISSIASFNRLRNRIILYSILVALAFIIIFSLTTLIPKIRRYAADKAEFWRDWENRLTRKAPAWLIGLALQIAWYFVVLFAFSPRHYFYDYFMIMLKEHIFAVIIHNLVMASVFLFIRRLHNAKAQYAGEVRNAMQEIAAGNFEQTIPVIGYGSYAQIASAANTIREGYLRALEEQKKSERLKYELVTNISHDLRTPLTSILNYIGLVKKDELSEPARRYAEHVDSNAKNLHLLIEDLFELSKIESGNMELAVSEADIVLLLKQISHEYEEKMKQNGLECIQAYSGEHCLIQCDSLKIWRIFDNVIHNAVKYSLPGTRIYIDAAWENGAKPCVLVSVKNIASYKMSFETKELFLRFKRGDEARSTEGSGLGLAIAKGLAELHGGNISIETEGDMFKVLISL